MTVPATLSTVSITPILNSNNNINSMNRNKYENEEEMTLALTGKSPESCMASLQQSTKEIDRNSSRIVSKFRIPKKEKKNDPISSMDDNQVQFKTVASNDASSSPTNQSTNDDFNVQLGKRKISLSDYKTNKRVKPNDNVQISSADVDMRMDSMENSKNSTAKYMINNSSPPSETRQVVNSKADNHSRDLVTKSNLSEPGVKKLIKKKVIWADEKNKALVQTSFFEIDRSEKTDMHAFARQCAENLSIAQVEKLWERDLGKQRGLQDINSFDNNDKQTLPSLPTLISILLPDTITIPIVKSQERVVQEEREKSVLQALFMRPFLPDSPSEPDGDLLGTNTIERNEPKTIPLKDNTSSSETKQLSPSNTNQDSSSVNGSTISANLPSIGTTSASSLTFDNIISPQVAQILERAKGNLTSAITTTTTTTSTPVITSSNSTITPTSTATAASNLLSALLKITQSNKIEPAVLPPVNPLVNPLLNLPLHFSLPLPPPPPPHALSMSQLLANALPFGLSLPTAFNNPMSQSSTTPFNVQSSTSSSSVGSAMNSNQNDTLQTSTTPFVSGSNQNMSSRYAHNNTNNERQMKHFRGHTRGHNYRRGFNNNHTRRDFHQKRNNNHSSNNRNIFS
ncbi:hypothetical protein I4U23_008027 [Adineta vaga]|nr:hypothetical protein I4U23_008027 [Adineta vaga]